MSVLLWQHSEGMNSDNLRIKLAITQNEVGDPSFLFHISIEPDVQQFVTKFKNILSSAIFLKAKILFKDLH